MRIFGLVITVLLLCSCSSLPQGQDIADPVKVSKAEQHPPLLFYTERLADQLFHKLQPLAVSYTHLTLPKIYSV